MPHLLLKFSHNIFTKHTVHLLPQVSSTLLLLVWNKFKQMPFQLTEHAIACCCTCHSLVFGLTFLTLNVNSAITYDKTGWCCQTLPYLRDCVKPKDQRPDISKCPEKLILIQATSECVLYIMKDPSFLTTQDFHICFTRDWWYQHWFTFSAKLHRMNATQK